MIKHKEALYEILSAEMLVGQSLYGICDALMKSSISKLSDKVNKFIVLGDFSTMAVETGRVKKKYLVIQQDIICGGVESLHARDGEVDAEDWAYELVKVVRTILRNNQLLVSTSYPTGVARQTYIQDALQEFVLYYETSCCIQTLRLEIQLEEDDS